MIFLKKLIFSGFSSENAPDERAPLDKFYYFNLIQ